MADVVTPLLVVAVYAVAMGGLAWLAARVRRRGGGGGLMGPFEELWHPAAVRARVETQVQEELAAPTPTPGDRLI